MTDVSREDSPVRAQDGRQAGAPSERRALSRREAGWVLRRCSRKGHIIAWVEDEQVAQQLQVDSDEGGLSLHRCLRCGTWVRADDVAVGEVVGSPESPVALAGVPQAARGAHGQKVAVLRLVSIERLAKGAAMIAGALVAYHVAVQRGSILATFERLVAAAGPLGQELGLHLTTSAPVLWLERSLGGDGGSIALGGVGLLLYGILQLVEGAGLWMGRRWAEYLAVVATSLFIPLEVYEIVEKVSWLKVGALILNVAVVLYLIHKGRLFGYRGGNEAYAAEIRDATEVADILRGLGRAPEVLTSERVL